MHTVTAMLIRRTASVVCQAHSMNIQRKCLEGTLLELCTGETQSIINIMIGFKAMDTIGYGVRDQYSPMEYPNISIVSCEHFVSFYYRLCVGTIKEEEKTPLLHTLHAFRCIIKGFS